MMNTKINLLAELDKAGRKMSKREMCNILLTYFNSMKLDKKT